MALPMKKSALIKLHLYCGLFTCFYLLAFGISSIILNHKIDVENQTVKSTRNQLVKVGPSLSEVELAEHVRNQLGMMGWLPPWEFRKDSNSFQFVVTHLAKTSQLNLDLNSGEVKISEIPKGFIAVLHGMHFFNGRIPNAPFFLKTWIVYQWLSLFVLFISMVLGIWLWLKFNYKTWEMFFFGGLFFVTVLLMILL
jgi:hypothetical protein